MVIENLLPNMQIIILSIFRMLLVIIGIVYILQYTRENNITTHHLTWWMIGCFFLITMLLIIQFGITLNFILWEMIISWGFFFFDSRRFAVGGLICIVHIILFTIIKDTVSAEYYAVFLYYFLVLSIVIGTLESYIVKGKETK